MTNITQYGKAAANVLADGTRRGLLSAADFLKLVRISLFGDHTQLISLSNLYLAQNAELSTGNIWNRLNAAASSQALVLRADGLWELRTVAAGANPITWVSLGTFTPLDLACAVNPPRALLYRTTNQGINSGTWTSVSFDFTYLNSAGNSGGATPWSGGSPTRFTAPVAGTYLLTANVLWAGNNAGQMRAARLLGSGVNILAEQSMRESGTSLNNVHLSLSSLAKMSAGDYFELQVFQDSGALLNITANGVYVPNLSGVLITTGV